jgi:phosphoribosylaminoimidazolecarboxamide formyltransferase/IMP cyclohydrolase
MEEPEPLPEVLALGGRRMQVLRYGENPHQRGAIYRLPGRPRGIAAGRQLQGKELSYCNYLDLDAAFRLVRSFREPAACVIKHTNPCGAAVAGDVAEAYRLAYEGDPRSAFGGIVGLNRPCTPAVAEQMGEVFLECVVAPAFEPQALELLARKRNLRLVEVPPEAWVPEPLEVRSVSGGLLAQTPDPVEDPREAMRVVTRREPTPAEWEDLLFALVVCAHVRSNAIVLARGRQAVGVGAGQMSRVEPMEIAIARAGGRARGSVAASEAFFPFPDAVEAAAAAGVTAIVQPGGSVRDQESIATADAAGMAMVFTGVRHFRH